MVSEWLEEKQNKKTNNCVQHFLKIQCPHFTDQEKLPMFYGNLTDYFKILDQDDSTLLIGAR